MKLANRIKMWKPRKAQVQRRPMTSSPPLEPRSSAWSPVDRFLALGTEGSTIVVDRSPFKVDELPNLVSAIDQNGVDVVDKVVDRLAANLCPKALVFSLAMAASRGDDATRKSALETLPKVCPTGPELLAFLAAVDSERGWGRGLRNAVAKWYVNAEPALLETEIDLMVDGWTHRDAIRLAHPKPVSDAQVELFGRLSDKGVEHKEPSALALTTESLIQEMSKWRATDRRILVAIDSTPSMRNWKVAGSDLSAAEAAAALSFGIARAEPTATIAAWGASVSPISVTKRTTLASLSKSLHGGDVGVLNLAAPIVFATTKKQPIDVFVIVTDNETTTRKPTPAQALATYRDRMGIDAKLVTIGMTSTGFSVADPVDANILDVVGFDASVIGVIRAFAIA